LDEQSKPELFLFLRLHIPGLFLSGEIRQIKKAGEAFQPEEQFGAEELRILLEVRILPVKRRDPYLDTFGPALPAPYPGGRDQGKQGGRMYRGIRLSVFPLLRGCGETRLRWLPSGPMLEGKRKDADGLKG
jgi:hypothetical protein